MNTHHFYRRSLAVLLTALLLALTACGTDAPGVATVTADSAVLHTAADDSTATDILLAGGSHIGVQAQQDGWVHVVFDGMDGYLRSNDVQLCTSLTDMDADGRITERTSVYAGPGRIYGKLGQAEQDLQLSVVSYEDGWYQVIFNGTAGYIPADTLILQLTAGQLQKDEAASKDDEQDSSQELPAPDNNTQQETEQESDKETGQEQESEQENEPEQPTVSLPTSTTSVLAAGVVTGDSVRIRTGPGTDYGIVTEVSHGAVLSVLDYENGWYKINYHHKTGYMRADFVQLHSSTDSLGGYAIVTGTALNLRSTASTSGSILATLAKDDCLNVIGFEKGWYQVGYEEITGWVSGDYVTPTMTQPTPPATDDNTGDSGSDNPGDDNNGDSTNDGNTDDSTGGDSSTDDLGEQIAAYAQTFLGKPYVLGGAGPDTFDCSGLIQYVYKHFGYNLPRVTNSQYTCGTAVSKADLQPGDLVFFYNPKYGSGPTTHAGIYIGDGKFIHATSYTYSSGTVSAVQIHPLSNTYYAGIYLAARRIID